MLDVITLIAFSGWLFGCFAASYYKNDVDSLIVDCEVRMGRKLEFY